MKDPDERREATLKKLLPPRSRAAPEAIACAQPGRAPGHCRGLSSAELPVGSTTLVAPDMDAVPLLLVPHLDRIYWEMGRRCRASKSMKSRVWCPTAGELAA